MNKILSLALLGSTIANVDLSVILLLFSVNVTQYFLNERKTVMYIGYALIYILLPSAYHDNYSFNICMPDQAIKFDLLH